MINEPAFRLSGIRFRFQARPAVECESLEVPAGRVTAFVGPNGSGKTTLLKLMNDLIGPFEGKADFFGKPVHRNRELRRRSVYLHQHPVLFRGTVEENLTFALRLKHFSASEARRRIEEISIGLNIAQLLPRTANRLSGGETQRISLARAVAGGADVLLLDEPTSSMDQDSEAQVRLILSMLKEKGTTIVMATHDGSLVDEIADGVVYFGNNSACERKER